MNRLARVSIAVVAALLLYSGSGLASWKPDAVKVPTPQESLERLDTRLAPTLAKMDDVFTEISAAQDEEEAEAYVTVIQRVAAQGYGILIETPWNACYGDYYSVLTAGFLLLGDSVDSYRVKDSSGGPSPEFRPQLEAALYLLTEYATLIRGVTDCGGAAEPTATPRPAPSASPVQ